MLDTKHVPIAPLGGAQALSRHVRAAVSQYIGMGWYPIPLNPGTKACRDDDWLERYYVVEDFAEDDNVGLRLVAGSDETRSVKLVAVDLDCIEAGAAAASLLPPTGAAWGRDTKPVSQLLYICPMEKPVAHKDLSDGSTILEIRVGRQQSMCPPSIQKESKGQILGKGEGERLRWLSEPPAASVVATVDLIRAVKLLATTALVSRYYPEPGTRHEWTLALAGAFRAFALSEAEAEKVVTLSAAYSKDDKHRDRLTEVRTTYAHNEDDPVTGSRKLVGVTRGGKEFVASLRKIWGAVEDFIKDKNDKISPRNQENIRRAIEKVNVKIIRDVFADRLQIKNGTGDFKQLDDIAMGRLWLSIDAKFGLQPTREFFETIVLDLAAQNPVHPVREYLKGLKWDGSPRLDRWLVDYAGASDNRYVKAVSAMVLIAAVRRVIRENPYGVKFDELVVLESSQGQGKSTGLQALCSDESWFSDDFPLGVEAKRVIESTAGRWIIEAAELVNIRKTQSEHLKSFLSRQVDGPVRLAYARRSVSVPRQFIIIGTTNSAAYLKDLTGNRRFWPIQVKRFDVSSLSSSRDQIWAEAVHRESHGEAIRMDVSLYNLAEAQQDKRRLEDAWETRLNSVFPPDEKVRVTPEYIWEVLDVKIKDRGEREGERLFAIMQRLGFRRLAVREKGRVVWGWARDGGPSESSFFEDTND